MRNALFFLLFSSLLLTLAIIFRLPLLEWSVPKYLSSKNFHNISLELHSFSVNHLEIKTFSADYKHKQQQYKVSFSQMVLQYTITGLFAKRVDRLSIQRAAITLPPALPSRAPTKQATINPSTVKDVIKKLQEVNIPVKEVAIKQLFFNTTNIGYLSNLPIALQLNSRGKELHSNLLFSLTNQENIEFTLHRKQHHPLSVIIRHSKKEQTVQTLQIEAEATQLKAQAALSIEELSQYVQIDQLQGHTGKVKASFSLQLKKPLSLQLQMQASGLQHPRYSVRALNLAMQLTLDADKRITISNASRLQAEGLTNGKVKIERLDLPVSSTLIPADGGINVYFSSPQPWQVKQLEIGGTNIQDIHIPPFRELLITKDTTRLTPQLAPLTIHGMSVAGWHVPKLTFTPGAKVPITMQTASETIKVTSPSWKTTAFTIEKDKLQLACESIHADLKNTAITTTLETDLFLRTSALLLTSSKMSLPVKEITGKILLKNQRLNAALQMMPSKNTGKIKITVKHGLNSGKGMARMTTDEPILFSPTQGIASLIKGVSLPLTMTSGKFNTDVEASWQKTRPFMAKASVQVTNGAGLLKEIPFSGLHIDLDLDLLPELRSNKPGKLEIAQINRAIPVTNLQGIYNISPSGKGKLPSFDIQQLSADIMQGNIKTDPFIYLPGADKQAVTIRAEDIDLSEIVGVLKVKGLQVDGKLNGYLPLTIDRKRVSLDNGEVYGSKHGGTIRFRPQGVPTQHSQLTAYALKALEEFHFTVLRAPVRYQADGTLLIDIQLQGVSPPLSTTRPVHLNIHTEQNLLSLLKSLRYNDALTKDLDKHLQKQY
ncbi:intermembrane phospholipid transport protein YdbH family protein [Desulfogranum marinum]|uniref:intermembrane phospholipid transport protein YdbH family protein n=1 Tax=Desulfogranum marinum TaxID=453220 RepID=UPI0019650107|nr:YdbH domain-containing protein [Desulfogranum marinum]MBM9510892.1 YdbH domain-containing protein [Desulfogranum marinum]